MKPLIPVGAALAALALVPPAAGASSIAYVKDHNVWLGAPDGSRTHQVTADGTAALPYRSPSQADDGTIAAGRGHEILRLRQNGEVIGRLDPPALTDTASHVIDGVPVDVAISPDGTKIAWSFARVSCPIAWECGGRAAMGITDAAQVTPPAQYGASYYGSPSWATNTRLLSFGGYLHHVNVQDLGAAPLHWFDDQDTLPEGASSTDLGDGELNRQGTSFAAVRGYGDQTHIVWSTVNGNALTGPPAAPPALTCATSFLAGIHGPSWSPDGTATVWGEPDGVWIRGNVHDCASQPALLLPGGSEPDWGPAPVNPPPPTPQPAPQPGPGGPSTTPTPPATTAKLTVRVDRRTLRRTLRDGLRVRVSAPGAGRITATAANGRTKVASGKATAKRKGSRAVTLRFTTKARRALRRRSSVTITLRTTFTPRTGARRTATQRVRLRR